MRTRKFMGVFIFCAMLLSSTIGIAFATETDPTVETGSAVVDPYSGVGSYMAFFQIQTTTWVYRNGFEDPNTGFGSEIFKTVYNNETKAPTSTVINDTVIDGDGNYTISLKNISLEESTDFNMVGISTNIPRDANIAISDVELKYNTKKINTSYVQKNDNKDYIQIMLINQYDSAMKDKVNTMVPADGTDMIITFAVSGFGYEKTFEDETITEEVPEATIIPVDAETASKAPEAAEVSGTTEEELTESTSSEDSIEVVNETEATEDAGSSSIAGIVWTLAGILIAGAVVIIIVVFMKRNREHKA